MRWYRKSESRDGMGSMQCPRYAPERKRSPAEGKAACAASQACLLPASPGGKGIVLSKERLVQLAQTKAKGAGGGWLCPEDQKASDDNPVPAEANCPVRF